MLAYNVVIVNPSAGTAQTNFCSVWEGLTTQRLLERLLAAVPACIKNRPVVVAIAGPCAAVDLRNAACPLRYACDGGMLDLVDPFLVSQAFHHGFDFPVGMPLLR